MAVDASRLKHQRWQQLFELIKLNVTNLIGIIMSYIKIFIVKYLLKYLLVSSMFHSVVSNPYVRLYFYI